MTPLLHMTTQAQWQAALSTGVVATDSLAAVGFVHLSTVEQVQLPANTLFRGRTDIVLLWIDPARLTAPLRWEPGRPEDPPAMQFPHLYGPLPADSVLVAAPYLPDPDGRFGRPIKPR